METDTREKNRIYRYLLGALPEAEAEALEQEFFANEDIFERVWAIENELVDGYVRGRLAADEKARFETHYLTSDIHRERVEFARALVQAADVGSVSAPAAIEKAPSRSRPGTFFSLLRLPLWQGVATAALLLLVAAVIWMTIEGLRLRRQVEQLNQERAVAEQRRQELEREVADEREHRDALAAELQRLRDEQERPPEQIATPPAPVPTPSVIAVFLRPLLMRSNSEPVQVKIAKETTMVRLQMKVEASETRKLQIRVQTVEGRPVANQSAAPIQKNGLLTITLPAAKLPPGDYLVTLSATGAREPEEINRYFFRVIKP